MTSPLLPVRALGIAGALALTLTGCGASLSANTYRPRPQGESANVDLQPLAVRNITVLPPAGGSTYRAGSQAFGRFTVADSGTLGDTLVSITSPDAAEVVPLVDGRPVSVVVPPRGTTGTTTGFLLKGLTADLRTGQYVTLVFTFERAGTVQTLVPVATTGRSQRPARTGEPGSKEGEPALQGPAGGTSEGPAGEGTAGSEGPAGEGTAGSEGAAGTEGAPGPATSAAPTATASPTS